MTLGERILAGIASVSPLVGMVVCTAIGLHCALSAGTAREVVFALDLFVVTVACTGGLLFLHISHVWRNKQLAGTSRKLEWTLTLLVCSVVAMPVYWYLHVWKEPRHTSPPVSDPEADAAASRDRWRQSRRL